MSPLFKGALQCLVSEDISKSTLCYVSRLNIHGQQFLVLNKNEGQLRMRQDLDWVTFVSSPTQLRARICNLRRHLKTHSGEKTNQCNQCDYAFIQAGDLRRHLKTHSGEKSKKCNQCDYASSRADVLRTHLKRHSGEKSNKCDQCDFASSYAWSLRDHMKMHSGEKSNKCNQCDYASSQAANLRI